MSEEAQLLKMIELTANLLAHMGSRREESSKEDKQAFAISGDLLVE